MIEIDGVTWRYALDASPVLSDLSLHIEKGQCVVLCGASGSGKSTALRLMNGLIPHFHEAGELAGTVRVAGIATRAGDIDEVGRVTGTVLQHPRRQFFTDTVVEELAFGPENFGIPPERMRTIVAQRLAGLSGLMPVGEKLSRLSGGQQQQVAIQAATTHEPPVVILDEPSSNLSKDAVERLAETLRALKSEGATIVLAEHRLRYLEGIADRVIVMRDGAIDREWSAVEFGRVSDSELATEGLRGRVESRQKPAIPATGQSIRGSVTLAESRGGELELVGIRCTLSGRRILEIDRLSFRAGCVSAIRGQNGAGKSTLARIIVGLQRAHGEIFFRGRRRDARARRRESAIVMQDVQRQLFCESVSAEISLAARATGDSLTAPLRELDIDSVSDRHPLSLSGGQQQRVVIAAARVADRSVVVFDEPSSGVDRRHLESIAQQMRDLADAGAVVILISHDEDLLALAADEEVTLQALAKP